MIEPVVSLKSWAAPPDREKQGFSGASGLHVSKRDVTSWTAREAYRCQLLERGEFGPGQKNFISLDERFGYQGSLSCRAVSGRQTTQ